MTWSTWNITEISSDYIIEINPVILLKYVKTITANSLWGKTDYSR
jgi:hypothetical protein